MEELCQFNHKNASNIQKLSPKIPQFGKKSEKCILIAFFYIVWEVSWPVYVRETGRVCLSLGKFMRVE